jgi:hypothetical protein
MQVQKDDFRRFVCIFAAMALVSILASVAFAQSSHGSVRGSVRDQTDAVIPGAKLELTNKGTNITLRTTTNEAGLYEFPQVIIGRYTLTVAFPGMETLQASLEVQVQVTTAFNAVLKPGSTESKVTVSAEITPMVESDNPALGHVLDHQRIEQLPMNGRSIENLLITVPGLAGPKPGASIQVRSFGMMAGAHDYYLDGAVLSEPMWEEGTIIRPPGLDTIQEFKVENNASSAKYSRMTNIILSTKSGTNQLHGAAFETNRNNAYGKARARTDFGEFPELSRNEYGANLGGPVIIPKLYNGKNRTFFFTAYEALRNEAPFSIATVVPTDAMRNGDFSGLHDSQGRLTTIYDPLTTNTTTWTRQPFDFGGQLNHIDPSRISPLAKYMFSVLPKPTFADRNPELENNWFGAGPDSTHDWTITERVDHRFTDNDQFYGRFTYGRHSRIWDAYGDTVPTLDKGGNWEHDSALNPSLALSWVHTFTPTLFNEVVASYAHTNRDRFTGTPNYSYANQLGLPNPFNQSGFPYIQNVMDLGDGNYLRPYNRNAFYYNFWIVDDNATKVRGKHELQFGFHMRYDQLNTLGQQVFSTGIVDFGNLSTALYDPTSDRTNPQATPFTGNETANAYLGLANYDDPLRKGVFKFRRPETALYFQDNIKVTPRLTVNLGLRWQFSPALSEANNVTIPGFDLANHAIVLSKTLDQLYAAHVIVPAITQRFTDIGVKFETYKQAGLPQSLVYNNWHDIGPHLGAAYRYGDGRRSFVVRGGYSRSYFNDGLWTWLDQASANSPFTADFSNYSLSNSNQSPDGLPQYGMRSIPTIIAGQNSKNAVQATGPNSVPLNPGDTYNWFWNPHQPTNYVDDWNVTLEKEIMANTLLRFGYVGNHGGNQGQAYMLNDSIPPYIWYVTTGTQLPAGTFSNVARNPYDNTTYGTIGEIQKTGYSNYSGFQFQFERRYSKGIAFQISYVIGNALRAGDLESGGGYTSGVPTVNQYLPGAVPADYNKRNSFLNYGRDASSPKHRINWNWIVDLPFGQGKLIGRNTHGVVNALIGGWQLAGLGSVNSTYLALDTSNWNFTGEPIHQYGYKYPIQDCRSGTCHPGYLWWNDYIPVNQINSHDAAGNPNGVEGVPANYKPAVTPLIPWGSTTLPANAPADTNLTDYWDTNTVWIKLKDGTIQRTAYNPNLHPFQNQYIPGPIQWNQDVSLFKNFRIREGMALRFTLDAFNVFNHPNNYGDNGSQDYITSNGILDTTGQSNLARQLQLSLRLSW